MSKMAYTSRDIEVYMPSQRTSRSARLYNDFDECSPSELEAIVELTLRYFFTGKNYIVRPSSESYDSTVAYTSRDIKVYPPSRLLRSSSLIFLLLLTYFPADQAVNLVWLAINCVAYIYYIFKSFPRFSVAATVDIDKEHLIALDIFSPGKLIEIVCLHH